MTKEEYVQTNERMHKYQICNNMLDKIDEAIENIDHYSSFTLDPYDGCWASMKLEIDNAIREDIFELLQKHRERVVEAMEEL